MLRSASRNKVRARDGEHTLMERRARGETDRGRGLLFLARARARFPRSSSARRSTARTPNRAAVQTLIAPPALCVVAQDLTRATRSKMTARSRI